MEPESVSESCQRFWLLWTFPPAMKEFFCFLTSRGLKFFIDLISGVNVFMRSDDTINGRDAAQLCSSDGFSALEINLERK